MPGAEPVLGPQPILFEAFVTGMPAMGLVAFNVSAESKLGYEL